MNRSLRTSLFSFFALLLLLPSFDAAAHGRKLLGAGPAGRYSVVTEYKDAYAKSRHGVFGMFGKKKMSGQRYARKHRTRVW